MQGGATQVMLNTSSRSANAADAHARYAREFFSTLLTVACQLLFEMGANLAVDPLTALIIDLEEHRW